ncbi:alpha/beta fold hydrolase [Streptomyces sp. NPDC058420]|uniref:alpha/beta fold hydrolase n=1 Tax=Streptomyces sp. NPDC058420 TaxID=3346489 RepID=UPI00364C241B
MAKVTAATPNNTATTIATVRAGRANGRASPSPTARDTGSRAATRAPADQPLPAPGIRPTANAAGVTDLYVADLAALVQHLRLAAPLLVGFASAGHVARRVAAQDPDLVGRLAVINGSPKFRRSDDWPYGFDAQGIAHFVDAAAEGGIEGVTDAVLDPEVVFADVDAARAARLGSKFREMSRTAGVRTLLGFFEDISLDDDRALIPAIEAPTLLMASTIGQEVPTAASLYLRTTNARARLAELPGADHFAFATRPDLVDNLLDSFVTS